MLLETIQAATITVFVENVFNFLWKEGQVETRILTLLKRNPKPQQEAFKQAFLNASERFFKAHPELAESFFNQHFLTGKAGPLLARCLTRLGPPNATELTKAWVSQFQRLSTSETDTYIQEYTPAAADFLRWLDEELRACPEFRELFDSYALDTTAQSAKSIEATQEELLKVTKNGFNQLNQSLQQLVPPPSPSLPSPILPTSTELMTPRQHSSSPSSGICPFEYGPIVPPGRFYGRHSQRMAIKSRIGGISAQCISIIGMRRSGKSSLLRYIKERLHEFCRPQQQAFVVTIDLQDKRFHTPLGLVEGLRRGIKKQIGRTPWEREDNDEPWAVQDGLEELHDADKRLIVLIDEFERLGSRLHAFQGWGEDWRSKASEGCFTLVIASLRPIDEIYQVNGLTSPFGNIFTQSELGALTTHDWQKLVRDGFARNGESINDADMRLIYDLAGGLPYYTQMAAALLWQHRDHSRTKAAFVHQATPRFTELWHDLKKNERQTLRQVAGMHKTARFSANEHKMLKRYGLLRADGKLFSNAFTDFVRGQS